MRGDLDKLREIVPDSPRQQKAREYSKLLRRGPFIKLGIGAILLLVLLLTPVSTTLASLLTFPSPWSAALYLLIAAAGYGVITAPLNYHYGFALPTVMAYQNKTWQAGYETGAKLQAWNYC